MPIKQENGGQSDRVCYSVYFFSFAVAVLIATYFLTQSSGSNGLYGISVAPLAIVLLGFIIATIVNLVGVIFAILRIFRNPCTSAIIGFLVNLSMPFVVAIGTWSSIAYRHQ
jgi:hypothetical protein